MSKVKGMLSLTVRAMWSMGAFLCLAGATRADWPHLRGPAYDSVCQETGLAETWPEQGPPLVWSRELGQGYSGFIVAQGKVFTQCQTLGGQYLVCLNADTGQTVWEYRYDWAWQPGGAYPGPYATPTFYRGKIFYTSPTGLLGCVDAGSGKAIWSVNVRQRFQGPSHDFGFAATPLVEDDKVIVPIGGPSPSLVALHVDDGNTVWTAGDDSGSYCPALPVTFRGRRCVVGYLRNALILTDLSTGELLHRRPLSKGYDEHSAWPLYEEPYLFLASPFRINAEMLELQSTPKSGLAARPVWTSRDLKNDIVSSVVYQGHLYGFDLKQLQSSAHRPSQGVFRCLSWSNGKVQWSSDRVGQATVLVADGKLILFNDSGTLILARADASAYSELGRVQLFRDATCWTPPTLWQGKLFVRGGPRAVCVLLGDRQDSPAPGGTNDTRGVGSFWRFDPNWLFSRERAYPNDARTWEEMGLWFASCLVLVFGGAAGGVVAGKVVVGGGWRVVSKFARSSVSATRHPPPATCFSSRSWRVWFWSSALVLGLLGPNLFSKWADRCLFTWPAFLYEALHLTLQTCLWADSKPERKSARWLARLSMLCIGAGRAGILRVVQSRWDLRRLVFPVWTVACVSGDVAGVAGIVPGPSPLATGSLVAAWVYGVFLDGRGDIPLERMTLLTWVICPAYIAFLLFLPFSRSFLFPQSPARQRHENILQTGVPGHESSQSQTAFLRHFEKSRQGEMYRGDRQTIGVLVAADRHDAGKPG